MSAPAVAAACAQRLHEVDEQQGDHAEDNDDQWQGLDPPQQDAEKHAHAGDAEDAGDKIRHETLLFLARRASLLAVRVARRPPRSTVLTSQLAVRRRRASLPRRATSCTPSGMLFSPCISGSVTAGVPR